MEAITFVNFTSSDFSWTWDGTPYTFKPGIPYMMEDWKAQHFAKHLCNHVLNMMELPITHPKRNELLAKCLPKGTPVISAPDASKLATELLNTPVSPQEKEDSTAQVVTEAEKQASATKRRGRKPKESTSPEEASFEGLSEKP